MKEQDLFFVKNLCAAYFLLKNIRKSTVASGRKCKFQLDYVTVSQIFKSSVGNT
jgi:hypothetical protein